MAGVPRVVVEGPAPQARPRNLLESTPEATEWGPRWNLGVSWLARGCAGEQGRYGPCDPTPDLAVGDGYGEVASADAFVVWAGAECTSMAQTDLERGYQIATERLLATQAEQVENELWTGSLATAEGAPNPFLAAAADVDDVTPGGGATTLADGLALLEQALADCLSGRGTIHATVQLASLWASKGYVELEGGRLVTQLGTIVIAGAGYPGTSPAGAAPDAGESWAYGTGMVTWRLGPIARQAASPAEAIDRDVNTATVRMERDALAVFDPCCLVGVNVDLGTTE